MRLRRVTTILAVTFLASLALVPCSGQEQKKEPGPEPRKDEGGKPQEKLSPLEKKFVETLSGATLSGKWRLVHEGKLGEEKEEKYTIGSVSKWGADTWVINARVQFGDKDATVPVPVKVFWAGDTPVISITNAGLPGLGTYTARVMIYEGLYTGTWFGPGHGGFLTGKIEKAEPKPEKETGKPAGGAEKTEKAGNAASGAKTG